MITIICGVARSGSRPMLFLPGDPKRGYGVGLPKGEVGITANGRHYTASIAKIACNVVRDRDGANVLPELLIGWFGAEAGAPGRPKCRVQFRQTKKAWVLETITRAATEVA